ncbi:helix-turn-helix domain-containing protein [Conchiformibius kuhniae]|uniref:Helix-turn-helix domain-containing protein n=1 Tax=Conchiformibius kuhniae TaxID=211502 RepID=A0A8T9MWE6_9NEIS|nr:helix-turn-helix transcriptional regulator [Conchiformibius kuhniae]UOP04512.1 helix-turn-helix domain-containing protein [Conchiformibius kuhniae]
MMLNDKIRMLRKLNNWSQEQMAEKMQMTKSGYAKIERGQSKINMERLEQIAAIFDIDVLELMTRGNNGGSFYLLSENSHQSNYYGNSESLVSEIEKLKLIIQHQQEMLAQKDLLLAQKESENQILKSLVATLQAQTPS